VAEWLRNGLQNRVHQFNSGRGLHKINNLDALARGRESGRAKALAMPWAEGRWTDRGPLRGAPITIKDWFYVPGLPTTRGLPESRNNIPERSAIAVAKLEQAGAVIFGKTNISENLADWPTFNTI
jgi:amidase